MYLNIENGTYDNDLYLLQIDIINPHIIKNEISINGLNNIIVL